jgi:hypothetical protein
VDVENIALATMAFWLPCQLRFERGGQNIREHDVERNTQLLRAMDMPIARWVRNYSVSNEGATRRGRLIFSALIVHPIPRLNTAPPAFLQNDRKLRPALAHLAGYPALSSREEPGILHHVRHERAGIPADREELQAILLHEVLENRMRAEPHAVAVRRLGEDLRNGYKGLHIASRSHDMDGDVEARYPGVLAQLVLQVLVKRLNRDQFLISLRNGPRDFPLQLLGEPMCPLVEENVDAALASDLGCELRPLAGDAHVPDTIRGTQLWRGDPSIQDGRLQRVSGGHRHAVVGPTGGEREPMLLAGSPDRRSDLCIQSFARWSRAAEYLADTCMISWVEL